MIEIGQFDIGRTILTMLHGDSTLKGYMGIPSADLSNIITFRDKYCVQAVISDALVINEVSRLVYRNTSLTETGNSSVKLDHLVFDIFVRGLDEYNVDATNRLIRRQDKIARRLIKLLNKQLVCGFKFRLKDKGDLYSAVQGYSRYFVAFEYKFIG